MGVAMDVSSEALRFADYMEARPRDGRQTLKPPVPNT